MASLSQSRPSLQQCLAAGGFTSQSTGHVVSYTNIEHCHQRSTGAITARTREICGHRNHVGPCRYVASVYEKPDNNDDDGVDNTCGLKNRRDVLLANVIVFVFIAIAVKCSNDGWGKRVLQLS